MTKTCQKCGKEFRSQYKTAIYCPTCFKAFQAYLGASPRQLRDFGGSFVEPEAKGKGRSPFAGSLEDYHYTDDERKDP